MLFYSIIIKTLVAYWSVTSLGVIMDGIFVYPGSIHRVSIYKLVPKRLKKHYDRKGVHIQQEWDKKGRKLQLWVKQGKAIYDWEEIREEIIVSNTPPQVGACKFRMPNLTSKVCNRWEPSGLVSRSAICCFELRWTGTISFRSTRSRTKKQSISTCFVLSWKTGLLAICFAASLSQNNGVGPTIVTSSSFNSQRTYIISLTAVAIARYSASAEERDTTDCFFDFQDIGAPPNRST